MSSCILNAGGATSLAFISARHDVSKVHNNPSRFRNGVEVNESLVVKETCSKNRWTGHNEYIEVYKRGSVLTDKICKTYLCISYNRHRYLPCQHAPWGAEQKPNRSLICAQSFSFADDLVGIPILHSFSAPPTLPWNIFLPHINFEPSELIWMVWEGG